MIKLAHSLESVHFSVSNGIIKVDSHNCYDTLTNIFTIPVTGLYQISSHTSSIPSYNMSHFKCGETVTITNGTIYRIFTSHSNDEWKKEKVKAGLEDILNGENSE